MIKIINLFSNKGYITILVSLFKNYCIVSRHSSANTISYKATLVMLIYDQPVSIFCYLCSPVNEDNAWYTSYPTRYAHTYPTRYAHLQGVVILTQSICWPFVWGIQKCTSGLSSQKPSIAIEKLIFWCFCCKPTQITKFMGPIWDPSGSCWSQMGPMLAPCTLLSG